LLKHKDKLKKQLAEDFLSEVTVYSFDRAAARKSALLFGKLKESGKLINENDLLIAGISLANDEVLLTRDQKFGNIDDANIKVV
jgi:predicted nucleic acid-binding protein